MTDYHLFGPCEPGTDVIFDGVIWYEGKNGKFFGKLPSAYEVQQGVDFTRTVILMFMCAFNVGVLVVDVRWKGRSFVGTLLDSDIHKWSPPK